jgi:CHASE3 domain sensor protein
MERNWTFGQKIGAGFAVVVALAIAIGAVSYRALTSVVAAKDRVIQVDSKLLIQAAEAEAAVGNELAAARGYLLSGNQSYLDQMHRNRSAFLTALGQLKQLVYTDAGRGELEAAEQAESAHQAALDRVIASRQSASDAQSLQQVDREFQQQVAPHSTDLMNHLKAFGNTEQANLDQGREAATATASHALSLVASIIALVVLIAIGVALLLTRTLSRQIGTAVGQIQSSSAELQAAANQQATGAKEQATAMNEIATTISELLATSRQIAESAQRVSQIAGQTASAAHSGDTTVGTGQGAITGIRRQVDVIVNHMLELGRKSQQIGNVLDIVSELAEQTNILAINATIEASGAGESGKRFAVVADEIRKLADRVTGSTKEVRGLIDDIRGAVNTTVMSTETGSKAVDAGSRQFGEVATAFKQITSLVTTTTEAAREIELSTKQQTTAVEQVNVAISNVAQATKETEASSSQTLQTASELTDLARDLLRVVEPSARPHVAAQHV